MPGDAAAAGPWPFVGRGEQLRVVREMMRRSPPGGALVVGEPGVGKTAFVRRCLGPGWRSATWAFGAAATAGVPLGAFAPVLPELARDASGDRLLPEAYRALVAGPPPALAVDGGHHLDELSALLVHQVATAGGVPVLVTARAGERLPEPVADLWKEGTIVRVELGPLDAAAVAELLAEVTDGPVPVGRPEELVRVSGGNPLYLREILAGGGAGRLAELVSARLAGLADEAREALEVVALGEPLELAHLPGLLDEAVLSDLEAAGYVEVVDSPRGGAVRLAQPVHAEVLRAGLPALRARRLNRRLAESVGSAPGLADRDRERIVRWCLAGGLQPRAGDLLGAARSALAHADGSFALACAEQGHALEPSTAAGVLLAEALVLAGRHERAEEVLAALDEAATGPDILPVARTRAANLYHWLSRPDEARRVLARAAAGLAGDPDASIRVAVLAATLDAYDGRPGDVGPAVAAGLTHPDRTVAEAAALVAGLAAMSSGSFGAGLEVVAGVRRTATAGAEPGLHEAAAGFLLLRRGDLTDTQAAAEELHRRATQTGAAAVRGWAAYVLGTAALLRGRPRTAESWFREAAAAMRRAGGASRSYVAQAGLAHALAIAGDPAGAAAALAEADATPGRRVPVLESEAQRARAWAGDGPAGLLPAAAEARARGAYAAEADLLHDAVRLGSRDPAALARLGELPDLVDGPLARARAEHARALLAADPDALAAAAAGFAASGADLLAAEAAAHAAAAARAAGLEREATALTRRSRAYLADAEDPRSPALAAGDGSRTLTGRELEIARLVAAGLPSRAVADELHLSARTVDNCLGRVFAKLGVSSRADLPAALADLGLQAARPPS